MGVVMKKRTAILAIALISTSLLSSYAFATSSYASEKKPSTTGATSATMSTKSKVAKALCRTTDAIPHFPQPLAAPRIGKREKVQRNVTITFKTNCGDIVVYADATKAPLTVRAIAMLANAGFYDQSLCHRLTTTGIFVLQCGDPTASGRGGPAFMIPDEFVPQEVANNYPAGSVAMANTGPNTSGSQFFIVYADSTLNPDFTLWGQVIKGLDIVKAIAAFGVVNGGTDGAPMQKVAIESVSVR